MQAIQQAITAAKRVNDVDLQAGMLSLLGQIHLSDRQAEKAASYYAQALELYRSLGRADEEVSTLSSLGGVARAVGIGQIGLDQIDLFVHGRVVDTAKLVREFGFTPRTTAAALAAFMSSTLIDSPSRATSGESASIRAPRCSRSRGPPG